MSDAPQTVHNQTPKPSGSPRGRTGAFQDFARMVEAFFLKYRNLVALVHVVMFVAFIGLLTVPLFFDVPKGETGPFQHIATFSLFAIWGLWFPLVFLSVIFTGRSWCGLLCPMGAASEWMNKIGPQFAIPSWLKWPGTPVISFLVVTVWAQTVGARDHVLAMAFVFGTTLACAMAIGFFFGRNKRAWCRHSCPIGLALGVYSRIGAVDFKPKRPKEGQRLWTEKTACPTMIDLPRKIESRHCIECFKCVQPRAKGGLFLRLRNPGEEVASIRDHHPNMSEIMFLFLGTGTALGGFLWLVLGSYQDLRIWLGNLIIDREWYWLGEPGPVWLMAVYPNEREVFRWFDFFLIVGYMVGWMALTAAVLSAATALAAWASGKLGGDRTFRDRFIELGYQFAPVAMISLILGLGGDLFHNLTLLGFGDGVTAAVKGSFFAAGFVWSLVLGERLLARQSVPVTKRWIPLILGGLGSVFVGAAWLPALFA